MIPESHKSGHRGSRVEGGSERTVFKGNNNDRYREKFSNGLKNFRMKYFHHSATLYFVSVHGDISQIYQKITPYWWHRYKNIQEIRIYHLNNEKFCFVQFLLFTINWPMNRENPSSMVEWKTWVIYVAYGKLCVNWLQCMRSRGLSVTITLSLM